MADNAVPTLAPEPRVIDVSYPAASTPVDQRNAEKKVLFDSLAQEGALSAGSLASSPYKAVFTGLLWFGYTIAVVTALALVWSAAKGMLGALSQ